MTPRDFRRIAPGLAESVEASHLGHRAQRSTGAVRCRKIPDNRCDTAVP